MSLQRRLLLYLLLAAPLIWALALWISVQRARHEVNELFDTELIRLARQVQATLHTPPDTAAAPGNPGQTGEADVADLALAVWDAQGRLHLGDREGVRLPRRPEATGFVTERIDGADWRVYYLQSADGQWLVAVGQKAYERDELVFDLSSSQILPWVLTLPLLLLAMAWSVRRALAPLRRLTAELQQRRADDLRAVPQAPAELQPLVAAMNGLFVRIEALLARERRFTADAAHELRTPLAVLRAQWDVLSRAAADERVAAEARFAGGLDRMDRLVTQLLLLSRVDHRAFDLQALAEVDWRALAEQAVSDCLALAERRRIEIACEWPPDDAPPLPLRGDAELLGAMLRNLLDNAARYAPVGSAVTVRFEAAALVVENDGEPLPPEQLARLGERFRRPAGQSESGSGLGLSLVQQIATLHGLAVAFGPRDDGRGMRVRVTPLSASSR